MHVIKKVLLASLGCLIGLLTYAQQNKGKIGERQRMDFDKHFFGGMKEKMVKNFDEAETEFRAAINFDPNNAAVHYQLATILLAQKKNSEAIFEASRAFNLDPINEWYSKLLLELYKNDKQYDEAIKVCEIASKNTSDLHFLFEQSGLYILTGKSSKAILVLNKIEKQQGITELVCRQKEEIFISQNNLNGATKEIQKLINAFPDQLQYQGLLADLYMANKKEKEAVAIYNKIQKDDILNGFAAFSLAEYYQQINDTANCFNQLVIGMRSSIEPRMKLQVLAKLIPSNYFGETHPNKCKVLVDEFANTNPDASEPYIFKGDLALQNRDFEEARTQYLLSTTRSNSNLLAWDQILFCDQQLGRYDYMKEDCEKVMELYPTYPMAYLFHSIACRQLKEYKLALNSAQTGIKYAEDEASLIQMLSNLGDIAHYANNFTLSDSAFESVLALDPNNSLALNNYAYFLSLRSADLDKAESMSKRSIELDPNNSSNLDTYGWILFQKKKYQDAKIYIEKSLAITPQNAEVLEHLGDVLFMLGNNEQALERWQEAKVLGANSNALDQKIKSKKLL
jgi:tetratricopeptide (TPR) repeat protein